MASKKGAKQAKNSTAVEINKDKLETKKKKAAVLKLLAQTYGLSVSSACREVGIDRTTFYLWKNKDPEFRQALDDMNESILDIAEASLVSQVQSKNTIATIFLLKTKGRSRGYIEKQEIDATVGIKGDVSKIVKTLTEEEREAFLRVAERIDEVPDEEDDK